MPTIKSPVQCERIRRQVADLKALRHQIERMVKNCDIQQSDTLLGPLNKRIDALEKDIAEYSDLSTFRPMNSIEVLRSLGRYLVQARLRLGWKQVDLAQRANLNPKVIHKYEKDGYLNSKLATVISIAEALEGEISHRESRGVSTAIDREAEGAECDDDWAAQ